MSEWLGPVESRLTALLQDRNPDVRRIARVALHRLSSAAETDAVTASGFVVVDPEMVVQARALADNAAPGSLPIDELIHAGAAGAGTVAALVTELIGRVIDDPDDAERSIWHIGTHLAAQPVLRPDLTGLLRSYRMALARSDDAYATLTSSSADRQLDHDPQSYLRMRLVIAWIVSRGGLAALVPALDGELGATEPARRYSAALLIAECAWSAADLAPPDVLSPAAATPVVEPTTASRRPCLDRDVQFTIYRPRAVQPDRWYPLLAFAHRSTPFLDEDGVQVDPLVEVGRQAQGLLGARMSSYGAVVADSARSLPRGDQLVFEPWLERGELNPPRAAFRWEEPVHRTEFRLRVPWDVIGQRLDGGMRVYLGVLIVAELRFALQVDADAAWSAEASPDQATRATPYRRIFASYSHRDTEIVKRVRAAAMSLGDRYLIDVDDLRAGELWEPRLAELIEEANVFQLFWSKNSMRSQFVRQEWEHALSVRRPYFIRPVFWEMPQPADPDADLPPTELKRIQFCRLGPDIVPAPANQTVSSGRPDPAGAAEPPVWFGLPMEPPASEPVGPPHAPLPPPPLVVDQVGPRSPGDARTSRWRRSLLTAAVLIVVLVAVTVLVSRLWT